jgi:hypothetical protein
VRRRRRRRRRYKMNMFDFIFILNSARSLTYNSNILETKHNLIFEKFVLHTTPLEVERFYPPENRSEFAHSKIKCSKPA